MNVLTRVAFDLDGCLIDSRELILRSYRDVCVDPPDDVLAYEGVNWLGDTYTVDEIVSIKRRKNARYLRHLTNDALPLLPALAVANRLSAEGCRCDVFTNAPNGTIEILKRRLVSWPFLLAVDGISTPARMRLLPQSGVYVDDQDRLVNLPDRWCFVRYTTQTETQLYEEILTVFRNVQ